MGLKGMKFARITEPLDLGDYHESYAGQIVHVWVNPPKAKRQERDQLIRDWQVWIGKQVAGVAAQKTPRSRLDAAVDFFRKPFEGALKLDAESFDRKIKAWMADLWSQAPDPETHWTVAELEQIFEADPTLYQWMTRRSIEMMDAFRAAEKKA